MGPTGSETWHLMLDGPENILREEGHAALTSRNVADRIGVKQRLLYYYFRTMDDLIVQLFHRMAERELARLEEAARSERPLRELWTICMHTTDARLISQFMALATRIEGLRTEVVFFIEQSRAIQVRVLDEALARTGSTGIASAESFALIATSVALSPTREKQLGISAGHANASALIENFIATCEGA